MFLHLELRRIQTPRGSSLPASASPTARGPTAPGGKKTSGGYANTRVPDGSSEVLQEAKTYAHQTRTYWAWTINNVPAREVQTGAR
ncbi:hypothetical protein [Pyxidicoccus sp. MSG2]|uniref:hypothetical protein n=1 Tax=Pyxidicoccus sp. MSG2 TaxID=2996790 RepID=UPI00226FD5E6|nr:hypothetical protein [Pyxidicoccus sp. MSG2]MCY1022693.1 hypothetical protein [Pyxidicoccus sp. MSG2]